MQSFFDKTHSLPMADLSSFLYKSSRFFCMPDFMELMAKGIKDSKRVLLNTIRDLGGTGGTAFTSLSLPEISGPQMALAGGAAGGVTNNRSMTINGLSVNINGYEAKDDNDLADTIVHKINEMLNEDDSVWGK